MKNVDVLLFDLDGTLSDSKEGITKSIAFTLEQMGRAVPALDTLAVFVGPPLRQTFKNLLGVEEPAQIERAMAFYRQRYVTEGKGTTENLLYPGIPDILKTLKKQEKRLYVATSKPKDITDKIIEYFGLRDFFENVYGSESDGTRSDKGELIAHIVAHEKISPQNAVMIGDREYDILGARKNNMRSIGACWGYGSVQELRGAGATALAATPQTLADIFLI